MIVPFKDVVAQASEMAKQNLSNYGYLEKVVITITDQGPRINALHWSDEEQKRKTIANFIALTSPLNCHFYVMVGEARMREIPFDGSVEQVDCILVTAETRLGERIVVITPIKREGNSIQFGKTTWKDDQEQLQKYAQFNLLQGIFGNR